ncbi:PqqD family protein [Tsuneonella mangrovi]|uniref:PqqD family protein n=1 Tax=Tsuneonella mangrovi TaxID=1982042 RepID=UPI001470D046|nr:PqqD family protein [Tsuneonella mangrovi]
MARCLTKIRSAYEASELDGEVVMIHADTGCFFALKGTGLAIWHALDEVADLDAVAARMAARYAVEPERCRREVDQFAQSLVEAGFARFA